MMSQSAITRPLQTGRTNSMPATIRFRCLLRKTALCLSLGLLSSAALAEIDQRLLAAVKQDNANKIADLVAHGVDPNAANAQGNPPLYIAIQEDAWKAVNTLVTLPQLQVDLPNSRDETPLMLAAIKGRMDLVKQLIARGAAVNREGWTPLHYAASSALEGQSEIVALLLENYAFINAQSPNETTPLMMAAGYGTVAVVKQLIAEGAFLDVKNQQGMTAIDFAKRANRSDVEELIAQAQRSTFTQGHW